MFSYYLNYSFSSVTPDSCYLYTERIIEITITDLKHYFEL